MCVIGVCFTPNHKISFISFVAESHDEMKWGNILYEICIKPARGRVI